MDLIGVVGLGIVGGTVAGVLRERGLTVRTYDRYKGPGSAADLAGCGVVFVCVPTPPTGLDGTLDVSEVWDAVGKVEAHLGQNGVVAIKSTLSPGTSDQLAEAFPRVSIVCSPEFLVATSPRETFENPDRIIVGARDREAAVTVANILRKVAPLAPVLLVRPIEAELAKLCSNAMLAAKVAMANELADVCERFGVSWPTVQSAVAMDQRIGPHHLTVTAERGFGGACLPKDLDGLIVASRGAGHDPTILASIASFNRALRTEDLEGERSDAGPGSIR